jgi:hypothetical protein
VYAGLLGGIYAGVELAVLGTTKLLPLPDVLGVGLRLKVFACLELCTDGL